MLTTHCGGQLGMCTVVNPNRLGVRANCLILLGILRPIIFISSLSVIRIVEEYYIKIYKDRCI